MVKAIVTDIPLLQCVSAPIKSPADEQTVVAALLETAKALGPSCAGLAAVQIGIPLRAFVIRTSEGGFRPFVNPIVRQFSVGLTASIEGCLSLPGVRKMMARHKTVHLSDGTFLTGQEAIIFQHEFDHLEGRLIGGAMRSGTAA